jgi:hypothetical protein
VAGGRSPAAEARFVRQRSHVRRLMRAAIGAWFSLTFWVGCVPPGPPPAPKPAPYHIPGFSEADVRNLLRRDSLVNVTPALRAVAGCYALSWSDGHYQLWPDTLELELAASPPYGGERFGGRVTIPGPRSATFDSSDGFLFYWQSDSVELRIVRLRMPDEGPDYRMYWGESSRLVAARTAEGFTGLVTVGFVGPGPLARTWAVKARRTPCVRDR